MKISHNVATSFALLVAGSLVACGGPQLAPALPTATSGSGGTLVPAPSTRVSAGAPLTPGATATSTAALPTVTATAVTTPPASVTPAAPSATPVATESPAPESPAPESPAPESPAPGPIVELIAGGGTQTPANGIAATDALLSRPSGVAIGPDGSLWITDVNLSLLMRVTADGTLADLATQLTAPEDLAVAADGTVYIADRGGYRVVSSSGNGTIDKVAGEEFNAGFRGDGGPARRALLWQVFDVAVPDSGDVYIADSTNQRIRLISAETGTIDTIVGTGDAGFAGDGGPAVAAQVYGPQAIAVDSAGTVLLIADSANYRLRRVDLASGIITTIAGTGTGAIAYNPELTGVDTPITRIAALAMDGDGNAYFVVSWADLGNVIMRLAPEGTLTRVVGGGSSSEPGTAASEFAVVDVLGMTIDPNTGALLWCGSDGKVFRVSEVAAPDA